MLKKYKEKPTAKLLKEIEAAVKPATTAKVKEKEKKVETVKAEIKKTKNEAKATKGVKEAVKGKVVAPKAGNKIGEVVGAVVAAKPAKASNKASIAELKKAVSEGSYPDSELKELEEMIAKSKKVKVPESKVAEPRKHYRGEH